jgi:hypothetical protein
VVNSLCAHLGLEFIAVLLDGLEVIFLCEKLAALELRHAGFYYHIGFEVQHALDFSQGHVQKQPHAAGQ